MTGVEVGTYRQMLTEERARVVAAIANLHGESTLQFEAAAGEGTGVNHPADVATETLEREIDTTLEENSEHVLRAIDDALERIEAGTYGRCIECGNPIAPERLEAVPWATLCIDCKRKAAA